MLCLTSMGHLMQNFKEMVQALVAVMDSFSKVRPGMISQGEQLADFDTRSILETADARGATADVPRKLGGSPTSRPTKRQRLGGIPKDSAPSASLAQGEPSPPGSRSHHSSPAYFISTWGQVNLHCPPKAPFSSDVEQQSMAPFAQTHEGRLSRMIHVKLQVHIVS